MTLRERARHLPGRLPSSLSARKVKMSLPYSWKGTSYAPLPSQLSLSLLLFGCSSSTPYLEDRGPVKVVTAPVMPDPPTPTQRRAKQRATVEP
jgi:hypothetical protein